MSKNWYEPCGRESAPTAVVGTNLFLWAGNQAGIPPVHESTEKRKFFSYVDVFQLELGSWEKEHTMGAPPLGVWGYACAAMDTDIYYFSGFCGHDDCIHNSVSKLSTPTLQWSELAATESHGEHPMKKTYSGMVAFKDGDEEHLFTIGGVGDAAPFRQPGAEYKSISGRVYTNEQHIFTLNSCKWSSPVVAGKPPPPCSHFSLISVGGNRAAMFGGEHGHRESMPCDLFIVELGRHCVFWTKMSKPVDRMMQWPENRSEHAAASISGPVILMIGGGGSDCWITTATTRIWKKLSLPESVTRRGYHSVSAFQLGDQCVWLLVFGGKIAKAIIACTAIVELIQGGDGQWSVRKVMEGAALANKKKYQSRLAEGRKWRKELLSAEGDSDRSLFEHHLWQQVQQLYDQIKHIEQLSRQADQTHQQEKRQLQDSLRRSEEDNQQLNQQLTQERSVLTKARQDLNSASTSLSETQQQVQQLTARSDTLDKEKKAVQDSLHDLEGENQQLTQQLTEEQDLLTKAQQDLDTANTSLNETKQQVQLWAARSDTLDKERKLLQDFLRRSEEENRLLHQQLTQERSLLTTAQQNLNSANASLSETQRHVQQLTARPGTLEMEKKMLQDCLHRSEEENQLIHQQLIRERSLLTKAQQDLESANTTLSETQLKVQQWIARSNSLEREKKAIQKQVQHVQIPEQDADLKEDYLHWAVKREELVITSEVLGMGGWGKVRVAKLRGYRVAAKCLHQEILSEHNIQQFKREMNISAKLRHPNVLLFMGATLVGEPIILTELLPTSLRNELGKRKLDRSEICSIVQDVAYGLSYLHQWKPHPIVHRDISSANILLESLQNGWRAKVSDYGSANFMNQISTVGPGSPAYAAPEARLPDQQTPKMDVYSFGVLLVEMCVGYRPEAASEDREAHIQRINWPEMVSLVRRCIKDAPADRPNMSGIVSMSLNECHSGLHRATSSSSVMDQNWYHTKISTPQAAERLHSLNQDGAFLVRDSNTYPGEYAISVLYKNLAFHRRIQYNNGSYSLQPHTQKCSTILDLVTYHKKQPIILPAGQSVLLKIGVSNLVN